jgi:hypothetical protein
MKGISCVLYVCLRPYGHHTRSPRLRDAESVSKRVKLADKYRVEKRVKAHKKKLKKEAKKNPLWKR